MAKVTAKLLGKDYIIACREGEEPRLLETIAFVEGKMRDIETRSVGVSDLRLFVLTCITLADELLELRRTVATGSLDNEELFVAAVQHLKDRVQSITNELNAA